MIIDMSIIQKNINKYLNVFLYMLQNIIIIEDI